MSTAFTSIHAGPVPTVPARQSVAGRTMLATIALAVVFGLAARVVELRPLELVRDIGNVGVFLKGYLNPSFGNVGEYAWQCVVTMCIALWGTVLALVVSVPLGLLGARNLSPHPLVYFAAGDYADATKAPPTYMAKDADGVERAVYPKPYKTERGFEQAKSFQLFSMGPDGEPNTEDDLKSWE